MVTLHAASLRSPCRGKIRYLWGRRDLALQGKGHYACCKV